nr:MAG TPA: hypothetical protein [Caudoviricetes sp.]
MLKTNSNKKGQETKSNFCFLVFLFSCHCFTNSRLFIT